MKKWFAVMLMAFFVFLAGCGTMTETSTSSHAGTTNEQSGQGPSQTQVVKLGIVLPVTGPLGMTGKWTLLGHEMAVKEINERGGFKIGDTTYTFELIHYDTEGKTESATAATERLISQDKVPVIIGTSVSSETAAMIPIAEREKTPLITVVAASDMLTQQGARFFTQAAPANINFVAAGVKTLTDMGIQNVALIYLDDAWGQSYAKLYPPKIAEAGLQVVAQEPFAPQQKEFVTLLNKVKATKPDGILLVAETELAVPLLKQIHEIMPDVPVMETGGTIPEEALKLAPEAAEGLVTLTRAGKETPEIKAFKERFKAEYGEEANSFHFSGRDGIYLVMDAMIRAGSVTDKEKINDAIRGSNFTGLIGTYTFNEKVQR